MEGTQGILLSVGSQSESEKTMGCMIPATLHLEKAKLGRQ
jgi:hypothetical protein